MGMSTHVIGFVPPDDRWAKMAEVWRSCRNAGIDPPPEVEAFFDDGEPDPHGQEVRIPHRHWTAEMREGIEIDVSDLPSHVKVIRFYNSW